MLGREEEAGWCTFHHTTRVGRVYIQEFSPWCILPPPGYTMHHHHPGYTSSNVEQTATSTVIEHRAQEGRNTWVGGLFSPKVLKSVNVGMPFCAGCSAL